VRAETLGLARRLAIEDQVVQPCEEASPTKWHLGHTTWFFERFVLGDRLPGYEPVDERYERIFNSYYHTIGPMHPRANRGILSRTTVAQIHDYRSRIDDTLLDLVESRPEDTDLAELVELGLNHEQQHQELLLTDAKQVLFASPLDVAYRETAAAPRATATVPLEFRFEPSGFAEVGADSAGLTFAFDNERPRHREWLEAHMLANRLVTNGEYREFIRAGGYAAPQW
jgi:ergothioneine biosynthesis protein EgtB